VLIAGAVRRCDAAAQWGYLPDTAHTAP